MQPELSVMSNFSTLVQLIAGISALCFYGGLLDKLVVSKSRANVDRTLSSFKDQLHGLMTDQEAQTFSIRIDATLNNYKGCINHLGKFTFCYCVLILLFSGLENYRFSSTGAIAASCLYVVVCLYILIIKPTRTRLEYSMWAFAKPSLILLLCFLAPIFLGPDPGLEISEQTTAVIIVSIIILILPFLSVVRYKWENAILRNIEYLAEGISEDFQRFAQWRTMPQSLNPTILPDPIRRIIEEHSDGSEMANRVDRYFLQRVKDCFRLLKFSSFLTYICRKYKIRIMSQKEYYIISLTTGFFIVSYLVIILQCFIQRFSR